MPSDTRADHPFLLPIESAGAARGGSGVDVTGTIEHGTLKVGDKGDLVGLQRDNKAKCTKIMVMTDEGSKQADQAGPGDQCRVTLQGHIHSSTVEPGMVFAHPGSATAHVNFTAEIRVKPEDEGGKPITLSHNDRLEFALHSARETGVLQIPEGSISVKPGETFQVEVHLLRPVVMWEGFALRMRTSNRTTIGNGSVSKIL